MNEETLIGIENELHNLNLNILELIKTIKDVASPRDVKPESEKNKYDGYNPFLDEYV